MIKAFPTMQFSDIPGKPILFSSTLQGKMGAGVVACTCNPLSEICGSDITWGKQSLSRWVNCVTTCNPALVEVADKILVPN